jgi:hypothetical protein
MGVVSATPILALGGGSATPKNGLSHPLGQNGGSKPPPCGPKGWLSGAPEFFYFYFYLYIYIKEIIKIIIKKNNSHVSAEVYHGDRCRVCTPTPLG